MPETQGPLSPPPGTRAPRVPPWLLALAQKLRAHYQALGLWGATRLVFWKLTGMGRLFRKKLPGIEAPLFLRVGTTDVAVLTHIFIDGQYDLPLPLAPKVIIDAGANIGLSSVFFAHKYPQAVVIAVEPEPSNYDMLLRNSAPYPNIKPVRAALWREAGQLELLDPGIGHYGFKTGPLRDRGSAAGPLVAATTVDRLLSEIGAASVDILKVDVEGAEKEVFESSAGWIEKVRVIMVELHDRFKPGCAEVFAQAAASFPDEFAKADILVRVSDWVPPGEGPVRRWR